MRMSKKLRLEAIAEVIETSYVDPVDLVGRLGITLEEIIERFPDKLLEHQEDFLGALREVDDDSEEDSEDASDEEDPDA